MNAYCRVIRSRTLQVNYQLPTTNSQRSGFCVLPNPGGRRVDDIGERSLDSFCATTDLEGVITRRDDMQRRVAQSWDERAEFGLIAEGVRGPLDEEHRLL